MKKLPDSVVRLLLLGTVVAAGYGVLLVTGFFDPDPAEQIVVARNALRDNQVELAESTALNIVEQDPLQYQAWLIAGAAAVARNDFETALNRYEQVPDSAGGDSVQARLRSVDILLGRMHRLSRAEVQLRRALPLMQPPRTGVESMVLLLGMGQRYHEQVPFILELIRDRQFNNLHLFLLAAGRETPLNPEEIPRFEEGDPDDPIPRLATAQLLINVERFSDAIPILRRIVGSHPEVMEAHAALGRALLADGRRDEILAWDQSLPPATGEHADIWFVRGGFAQVLGQPRVAIRCYWESARRDPANVETNYLLARLLKAEGGSGASERFLNLASKLQEFRTLVDGARTGREFTLVQKTAESAEAIGLIWEAAGWAEMAIRLDATSQWAKETTVRLGRLTSDMPLTRIAPGRSPAEEFDLSKFPLPDWGSVTAVEGPQSELRNLPESSIQFVDSAGPAGLSFRYFNGGDPVANGLRKMYELTGGGVGVLDFDNDGWPDLYLTQGSNWPPQPASERLSDRLYRNGGVVGTFRDATESSTLKATGFGQGVAAGDINSDGFTDLYVSNIGSNQIYFNNGDGTFASAEGSDTAGGMWNTSCAIADLNGDGLADLYAVNYLTGPEVFTRSCEDLEGVERHTCPPSNFSAAQDKVYLNRGDGTFADQTATAGIAFSEGRGLGLIVARLTSEPGLSVFVANDGSANALFQNRRAADGVILFSEGGLASGLACNGSGRAEASMGVASGDVDGDGILDFLTTNFSAESNTLYIGQGEQSYVDKTSEFGLHAPTLQSLGFGTQFLDANLDGWLDLLITNGHVNDFRYKGEAFRMPPQLFRNIGGEGFVEESRDTLGEFFAGQYLGRGLAVLDWNRDGRPDAAISHLDVAAALLTNMTRSAGNYLAVGLRGIESERDAIGAIVTVKAEGRVLVRQLTAGDGYQASNEHQLLFGLGNATTIDDLQIAWPSGTVQNFSHPGINRQLVFVENNDTAFELPR